MWKELSEEVATTTERVVGGVIHVGGKGVAGRTALVWAEGLAVTLARQATEGESVPVGWGQGTATVKAWDHRTGLTLLEVPGLAASAWDEAPLPRLGSLVLTVAQPSTQGPEARLETVRFVAQGSEWAPGIALDHLLQTDGSAFPGFWGAAVVDFQGRLVGMVAGEGGGNQGFVVPFADLKARIVALEAGRLVRPWLGASTRPAGGQGLVLLAVEDGGPAARAGWTAGDVVLALGPTVLRRPSDLVEALGRLTVGTEVGAKLLRDAVVIERPITPEGR